jgi:hypothetical protein
VVIDDVDILRAVVADDAVALLTQVFDALRTSGNVGVRGMWGMVADQLGSLAVWRAHNRSEDAAEITRRFHQAMTPPAADDRDRAPAAPNVGLTGRSTRRGQRR